MIELLGRIAITLSQKRTPRQQTTKKESLEIRELAPRCSHEESEDLSETSDRTATESDEKHNRIAVYRNRFSGWRFGVSHFAAWAVVVFIINASVTIWGWSTYESTEGILTQGHCGRVKNLNRGLHVLINVLSTILLSGSSYCMQCLSAPTRAEVDKAHARRIWLDVGVLSFRNLRHIGRWRLGLWAVLGLSSVPLHLLYNSAIYASVTSNDYEVYMVGQGFLNDSDCYNCTSNKQLNQLHNQWRNGTLSRLEPAECLSAYASTLQSQRGDVLLVTDNVLNSNVSTLYNNTNVYWYTRFWGAHGTDPDYAPEAYQWICSGLEDPYDVCTNRVDRIMQAPDTWEVGYRGNSETAIRDAPVKWPVRYCLSYVPPERCRLYFNPVIAAIVTGLNLLKALLMVLVLVAVKDNPILTIGDAVTSFLNDRDPVTTRSGLTNSNDWKKGYIPTARPWDGKRYRWKDIPSKLRRAVFATIFTTNLVVTLILLARGVQHLKRAARVSLSATFSLGLGAIDPRATINSNFMPTDVTRIVLIANLPQLLLSFLYFSYNGLFTAMLLGHEWMSYASKRKGLRVSRRPIGEQRSTYFLQLPYRFGLPLVVLSGILHWLVSQSIFLVSVDVWDWQGKYSRLRSAHLCGFSPTAILLVVLLGFAMGVVLVGCGCRRYKGAMPLAGSCSLAMSAACHPERQFVVAEQRGLMSTQKIQWGVISVTEDGIGHCAFSSEEVKPPIKGRLYA